MKLKEAVRAKGIAEKKSMGMDYAWAKKFALQAQSCIPSLRSLGADGASKLVLEARGFYLISRRDYHTIRSSIWQESNREYQLRPRFPLPNIGQMTFLIITLPHTWTWIKNMQLRPPSENLINFGLSASDVSCIIHLQILRSHPRRQDIMPPIAILLIPKEMVVKVQDLRGLKSTFQLTAQTSRGVILLE
uniref:Uncharacterized protein n=1 Tax=Salix viminalis TaxID=40686 RepID=A0A6N2KJA5_SALVM